MATEDNFSFSFPRPYDTNVKVLEFSGEEGISQLFRFDILFDFVADRQIRNGVSVPEHVPLLLGQSATLTFSWGPGTSQGTVSGSVAEFHMGQPIQDEATYGQGRFAIRCHATLVPRLHRLTLTQRSRLFANQNVLEIVRSILKSFDFAESTGNTAGDFIIDVADEEVYKEREYCIQYNESDFDFVSRLLEDEGLFYFFLHADGTDTLFITDKRPIDGLVDRNDYDYLNKDHDGFAFKANSGLIAEGKSVLEFSVQQKQVPNHLRLFDDNFDDFHGLAWDGATTSQLSATTKEPDVNSHGAFFKTGRDYTYLTTKDPVEPGSTYPDEPSYGGDRERTVVRLTQVRSHELAAQKAVCTGVSECADFLSGFPFEMRGHYLYPVGHRFLITRVVHFGGMSSSPNAGRSLPPAESTGDGASPERDEPRQIYYNEFSCIRQEISYRPPRRTRRPSIPGVITAKIEKDGEAWVDSEGRYAVQLPFDLPDKIAEEGVGNVAVARKLRMAQPYSGPDYGIHFPNREGTEAVLAFIDGDVDRPIMLSTVPNYKNHTPTPVEPSFLQAPPLDHTELPFDKEANVIRTSADNLLLMDDNESRKKIMLYTPGQILGMGGQGISLSTLRTTGDLNTWHTGILTTATVVDFAINALSAGILGAAGKARTAERIGRTLYSVLDSVLWTGAGIGAGVGLPGINMVTEGAITAASAGPIALVGTLGVDVITAGGVGVSALQGGVFMFGAGGIDLVTGAKALLPGTGDISFRSPLGSLYGKANKDISFHQGKFNKPSDRVLEMSDEVGGISLSARKGSITIEAEQELVLKVGENLLSLTPNDITLQAKNLFVSGNKVTVQGKTTEVLGEQKVVLQSTAPSPPVNIRLGDLTDLEVREAIQHVQGMDPHRLRRLTRHNNKRKVLRTLLRSLAKRMPGLSGIEITPTDVKVTAKVGIKMDSVMYDGKAKGISKEQAPLIKKN